MGNIPSVYTQKGADLLETEYVVQTADTGEFIPLLASDRYEALRKLADVQIEALYMESQSPDTAFSHTGTYAYHLVHHQRWNIFYLGRKS